VGSRSRAAVAALAVAVAACTLPPLESPTASPSPTPVTTASVSPSAAASPSGAPSPTFDPEAVPDFAAGDLVRTATDGLRVRQRPGSSGLVVTGLLPLASELQVVLGPMLVDALGWYLVTDADGDEPQFEEGWVAAGFEPEAWLTSTGERAEDTPFVASSARTGDADFGPVTIGDGPHAIRWVAADPDGGGCRFAVSLAAGFAEPVPAIRATLGSELVPGTLHPQAFDAIGVRGQAFFEVRSDCAWALTLLRVPDPEPTPPS
jgi:hypothetical protein